MASYFWLGGGEIMLNIYFRVMKQKQMNLRLWGWTGLWFLLFLRKAGCWYSPSDLSHFYGFVLLFLWHHSVWCSWKISSYPRLLSVLSGELNLSVSGQISPSNGNEQLQIVRVLYVVYCFCNADLFSTGMLVAEDVKGWPELYIWHDRLINRQLTHWLIHSK